MRFALTDVVEELLGISIPERSANFMTRCPFHGEQHASLSISLDTGLFICFACGVKGGLNTMARLLNKDLNEGAVLIRSMEAAVSRGYEEAPDFTPLANNLHEEAMTAHPDAMAKYFLDRGLHASVLRHYKLGWDAARQRVSMPYWDDGACIGIKYRALDGSKTSEKGSKRYIYGVDDARGRGTVILCEGESDTHAAYSYLTRNDMASTVAAVGFPGVSASRSNWELYALELMWASRVIVAYDADEAGDKGADLVLSVLGEKGERFRPTHGKDIAEHLMAGGRMPLLG